MRYQAVIQVECLGMNIKVEEVRDEKWFLERAIMKSRVGKRRVLWQRWRKIGRKRVSGMLVDFGGRG